MKTIDYQRLFRILPDSLLLLLPDGTVADNSDAHVQVSLLPREQAVGHNIFAAYPSAPESQRELFESHEYVRQHLVPHTMPLLRYDLERPAEQGGGTEERYWQITHYPLFDEQGRLEYILQRPQDVTAQTLATRQVAEAAQALAESQARSQFILDSLPVMVWTNTPAGQPDYFNPRWLAFTGQTLPELQASDWHNLAHPDDQATLLAAWREALASGQPLQHEYRLRRHDGAYRWVLIQAAPRRADDGHLTMWVGSAIDIHAQRQMVAELLQANEQQAALAEQAYETYQRAESQRRTYDKLFNEVPALIAILRGPEHRYDFVNPAYQQVFPHRQLLGRAIAEALPEVAAQGLIGILNQVYATGQPFRDPALRVDLERQPGTPLQEVYVDLALQQFTEQNQPAGIMVFAVEVTDLVRARAELAELRARGTGGPGAAS
ncbi:PAS domain-containing protein [Hymenobacter cheonanensis]|uniref:PAS domain-containing protein n=1 Tax=Hymenobacter sp. CA2-7 TaxID=3063993 RepID=UPI00271324F9|nr:PAS domain-containing protein [Hymenobacter sp. CA2-7]MDO7884594.1 PAS domain-containing protein [Hymenobacter sp. CA2-7]